MSGHPGSPGAQVGTGISEVTDWCVERVRAEEEETEIAPTPAHTMERAKMRMARFIFGNLSMVDFNDIHARCIT